MNKIDINKKYKMKDGRKVTILTTTANRKNTPVVGLIHEDGEDDSVAFFSETGRSYWDSTSDLIEYKPVRVITWLVDLGNGHIVSNSIADSEDIDFDGLRLRVEKTPNFFKWVSDVVVEI